MIVYAARKDVIIWEGGNMLHKQGRVPLNEPLIVRKIYKASWYIIERPKNISLAASPRYPDYWVRREDTMNFVPESWPHPDENSTPMSDPVPVPEVSANKITDNEAVSAILMLLKWLKQ